MKPTLERASICLAEQVQVALTDQGTVVLRIRLADGMDLFYGLGDRQAAGVSHDLREALQQKRRAGFALPGTGN